MTPRDPDAHNPGVMRLKRALNQHWQEPVVTKLAEAFSRVSNASFARHWWERLGHEERARLGGNLERAYARGGTIGMWNRLHARSTPVRAAVELAHDAGLMSEADHRWLKREVEEVEPDEDLEERVDRAVRGFRLVLVQGDNVWEGHWDRELFGAGLAERPVLCDLLWKLAKAAGRSSTKGDDDAGAATIEGQDTESPPVTRSRSAVGWSDLIRAEGPHTLSDRRSKLKEFLPPPLDERISGVAGGRCRLNLPASAIWMYDMLPGELLMRGSEELRIVRAARLRGS